MPRAKTIHFDMFKSPNAKSPLTAGFCEGICIIPCVCPLLRFHVCEVWEKMLSEAEVLIKIKNLLVEKPKGMTTVDIAKSIPLNRTSTSKYLNTLLLSGQIERYVFGHAKVFKCCNRVPMAQILSYYTDPIIVVDHELMIREMNPQFIEIFGIPKQDVIGKKFNTLSSEVDITHTLIPGICNAIEGENLTKNHQVENGDKKFQFRTKYLPVVLDDGRSGAAVILENVTETYQIQQKYDDIKRENTIERSLRADAEEQLAHSPKCSPVIGGKTQEELIHELQVHQIELETQAEELRRAHLMLEESRDKYLDLYDFAPLGYLTLNDKALVTSANLTGASLLGIELNKLVNHGLGLFIAPDDIPVWDRYFADVRQHKEKQSCTLTLKRNDGSTFPARLEGVQLTGSDDAITVRIALSDITDIRQAEAALRDAHDNLDIGIQKRTDQLSDINQHNIGNTALATSRIPVHEILDILPELVIEIDTNLKPRYVNPVHQKVLGYSPEELMAGNFLELVHPDEQDKIRTGIQEAVDSRSSIRQVYRIRHKDGHYLWLESVGNHLYDAEGRLTGGIISSRDISDRVCQTEALQQTCMALEGSITTLFGKAQEIQSNNLELNQQRDVLHKNEKIFHAIFENAYDAIFLIRLNPDGTSGEYIDVNEAACRLLGYSRKELLGMSTGNNLLRTPQSTILPIIAKRMNKSSSGWFDVTYTRNDGKVIPVEALVRIIPSDADKIAMVAVREIREREEAEDALHESERKFHALFDQTFQFIGMMTLDGTLIEANRTAMQFAGIKESDCLGKPFWDTPWWTHSAELQKMLRDAVKKVAKGETVRFEATHPAANGSIHNIDFSLKPIKDENGKVIFLIPEGRDITELKRADELVRVLARMSDDSPASITVHDFDGNFVYVNEQTLRLHGYTREEYLKKNLRDIDVPESEQLITERMNQIRETGEADFEVQHFRKDGSKFPLQVKAKIIVWGGRKVLLSIATDITVRKHAEEALRVSEEHLRTIVDTIPGVLFQFYARSSGEMGVYFVRGRSEELFGLSGDPATFFPKFTECVAPEDRAAFLTSIDKAVKTCKTWDFRGRYIKPTGEEIYFHGSSEPV